jgi:hypothetical protein
MKQKISLSLALLAVLITIFFVWYGQRPAASKQATWDDVVAEADAGGYRTITTEALAEIYDPSGSDPMLIDTRQEWEYRTGHIEGALNFSMEPTWWARWQASDELATFLGPDKERTLVFY